MDPADLRAFAHREWAAPDSRLDYWAERYRIDGPSPARLASTALYEHARRLDSPIFKAESRDEDLAHHRRVCDLLDRAAHAFADL